MNHAFQPIEFSYDTSTNNIENNASVSTLNLNTTNFNEIAYTFGGYNLDGHVDFVLAKGLSRNKLNRIEAVILCGNKLKNISIAQLWWGFLTKLACKRTSLNGQVIPWQTLRVTLADNLVLNK